MKIKLIAPQELQQLYFQHYQLFYEFYKLKAGTIPIALPLIAALTPKDIEVKIEDESIAPIDFDEKVDLVGITGMTSMANRMYQIADEFRKRNVTVVLGGIHASMCPDEALTHSDTIVIGEAEETWPQLIEDYKNNQLKKIYKCERFPDLALSPIPRWDLLEIDKYMDIPIQTTRGCPFSCDFCTVHAMTGQSFRHKPIANIVKEIEALIKLTGKRNISFVDDNIIGNKIFAKKLFKALIPLNIKWLSQASINLADDDELLTLAKKSGMWQCPIGLESVSQNSLDNVNKAKVNKTDQYLEKIYKIQSFGISVVGAMILGLDGDEKDIFRKTYEFLEKAEIPFSLVSILTPLPGTKLYDRYNSLNKIIDKNWDNYIPAKACIKPELMSVETLQDGFYWLVKKLYYFGSTLRRLKKQWKKGLLVNIVKPTFSEKFLMAAKLVKVLSKEKLMRYFPSIVIHLFLTNAQPRSIIMALHLHQAVAELPEPRHIL
ncbi:B12-binding domain-containing radical SAM protein [Candidatus Margulisiibacteriota bacterium]